MQVYTLFDNLPMHRWPEIFNQIIICNFTQQNNFPNFEKKKKGKKKS